MRAFRSSASPTNEGDSTSAPTPGIAFPSAEEAGQNVERSWRYSLFSAILATVVLGLGLGLINLMISSRIGRMDGEKGKIVSLFNAAVGSGIFWGPIYGGIIGQRFGNHLIFVAFVPLFLGLALLVMIKEPKKKQSTLPQVETEP